MGVSRCASGLVGRAFGAGVEFGFVPCWSCVLSNIQNNQRATDDGRVSHNPVMLREVLQALAPAFEGTVIDGTFGAGGYSGALLEAGAHVVAIDRDPHVQVFADKLGAEFGSRFEFVPGRFSALDRLVEQTKSKNISGVVLDIGVSSMQLDEGARGFSFMRDGPLDMGMGKNETSAAELVNNLSARELSDIIFTFGEEKRARRIAQAIVEARSKKPIETTLELAQVIETAVGRKPGDNHPATRSFQALRIAVNQEMGELVEGLFAAERVLPEGGLLVVVTFHSLEDRIVKRFFDAKKSAGTVSRHMPQAQTPTSSWEKIAKPVCASAEEIAANPRARSATLRCARRTGHDARKTSFAGLGVPGSKLFGTNLMGAA